MSQRFFRCRICGQPHEIDTTICPVHGIAIPPQRSLLPPASAPKAKEDEVTEPRIPGPPLVPAVRASNPPPANRPRPSQLPPRPSAVPPARARRTTEPPMAQEAVAPPAPRVRGSDSDRPVRARTSEPPPRPSRLPPATDTAAHIASLVGNTIDGRYLITGVIAEGGMGVVYDAQHTMIGRRVALKALARRFAEDMVAVTRFRNEARAAGALGHPNIVEVSDFGTLPDGSPYLVMERLEGETLGQRLRRDSRVAPTEAQQIVAQILSALAATHARDILHRDLKPENIFLSTRPGLPPLVKILDFGISKQLNGPMDDPSKQLTRAGFVMGTPGYMAPEQARGERNLDGRVDLYAVGVLAYEMLSGRLAYSAKNPAALVTEMRNNPPPPLRTLRREVSDEFEMFVHTLMALDKRQRFESATVALHVIMDPRFEALAPDDGPTVVSKAPDMPPPEPDVSGTNTSGDDENSQRVQIFAWNSRRP
jgi:serine/threonine-protein kinase